MSGLMSTQQVADALGVTKMTVTRWCREGKLAPIASPSHTFKFRTEDIQKLLSPRTPTEAAE